MAAAYSSRDIVEDYLRYKLLSRSVAGRFPPRIDVATSSSSWLVEQTSTSRRGVTRNYPRQDSSSAPPQLQVVLRAASDELEHRYSGDLSVQVLRLCRNDGGAARWRSLSVIKEELFRNGVNWGRIVTMMALGGALSAELATAGELDQVDEVAGWLEESLDSAPLHQWIEDNGGWDAFVELYGSRAPVTSWSLRTLFGLVVLGAAGITLGALFTQK
ncbi:apoptosis regulator Bcl-2-like [Parambassis ranga]|uniref:Apoptosis regulator Bcl-2-like n=1 Tax=Parambassis ranga TaxID=210632 RepID=A0A6P7KGH2_9TELE|nr:apoptosis regulator Bcl-2-like [Parambassis ranga]